MNIIPTLEGGLRVDIEDAADWMLMHYLVEDPEMRHHGLADELCDLIEEPEIQDDWREFVVPDLEQQFAGAISKVSATIIKALKQCEGGPGCLWITREDGSDWYSALNQARLAIEDRYQFGDGSEIDPEMLEDDVRRTAWRRSHFYSVVQGMLLDHVLSP